MVAYSSAERRPWKAMAGAALAVGLTLGAALGWSLRGERGAKVESQAPQAEPEQDMAEMPPRETPAPVRQHIEGVDPEDLLRCERELTAASVSLRQMGEEQARLLQRVEAAEADAIRYRDGLEKAVATLNAQQAAARTTSSTRTPAQRRPSRVSSLTGPYIGIEGTTLVANGKLWNSGDTDARIDLEVELIAHGQVIETGSVDLEVNARTDRAWHYRFRTPPRDQVTYEVNVRLRGQ